MRQWLIINDAEISDDVAFSEVREHRPRKQKGRLTFSILARSSVNSLSFTLLATVVYMIYKLSQKP